MKRQTKTTQKQDVERNGSQRIERNYSKDNKKCRIAFWLPKDFAPGAQSIAVAGSFNGWDPCSHPLKKLENGDFSLTVEVAAGKEYQFRFVVDDARWENAGNADKYVWSEYAGCENSVIVT